MNNYREILSACLKRGIVAAAIGGFAWWLLATASGGLGAVPRLFLGVALLVLAAIIVAMPLAGLIAEPSGSLFYPGRRLSRALPMYSIPESKRAKGLYEEAMAGFEDIATRYPDEVKPYVDMIDISIMNLKDANRADAIFERGVATLTKEEDREQLARMHRAIRSRLNARS